MVTALRVGLIGCGSIAVSAHIPALMRLKTVARLEYVCDVRQEAARQVADATGVKKWTSRYEEVLSDPTIDAVIITTPEFLHAEQTIAAAQAGKHVLCEKPIAASLVEADAMIAAAQDAGIRFMVAHSRRFTARYQAVRQAIDEGVVGDILFVRENERRPVAHYSALNLPVDIWKPDSLDHGSWKDSARFSGGVARGHAIHEMDLFRWFAGSDARQVVAASKIVTEGREVPDAMTFHIRFENGVLAACDLYTNAPPGYPYFHQLEIVGSLGTLRARDSDMQTLTVFSPEGARFPSAYETLLHVNDAYYNEQLAFFSSIVSDEPLPLDPLDARAALELSLAASHSAAIGEPVDLPFVDVSGRSTYA